MESIVDEFGAPKLRTSVWDKKCGNFVDPEEDRSFWHGLFSTEWEAWDCLIKEMQRYTKAAIGNYKKRKIEMVFGGKK